MNGFQILWHYLVNIVLLEFILTLIEYYYKEYKTITLTMYLKLLAIIASVVLVAAIAVNTIGIDIVNAQSGKGDPGPNDKNRGQCLQSPHPPTGVLKKIC